MNSPLSADSVDGFALYSVANTTLWLSLLLLPAVVAMLVRRGGPNPSDPAYNEARAVALWTVAPAGLFYLVTFSSEPGYFLGAMPSVVTLTVIAASGIPALTRRRLAYTLGAVAQPVILVLPTAPPRAPICKIPSIPELVGRERPTEQASVASASRCHGTRGCSTLQTTSTSRSAASCRCTTPGFIR